ncbi:hypothetical protein PC128_g20070, partial [Phytophthora cactorum]
FEQTSSTSVCELVTSTTVIGPNLQPLDSHFPFLTMHPLISFHGFVT